jgi:hypothetical protein
LCSSPEWFYNPYPSANATSRPLAAMGLRQSGRGDGNDVGMDPLIDVLPEVFAELKSERFMPSIEVPSTASFRLFL